MDENAEKYPILTEEEKAFSSYLTEIKSFFFPKKTNSVSLKLTTRKNNSLNYQKINELDKYSMKLKDNLKKNYKLLQSISNKNEDENKTKEKICEKTTLNLNKMLNQKMKKIIYDTNKTISGFYSNKNKKEKELKNACETYFEKYYKNVESLVPKFQIIGNKKILVINKMLKDTKSLTHLLPKEISPRKKLINFKEKVFIDSISSPKNYQNKNKVLKGIKRSCNTIEDKNLNFDEKK